MRRDAHQQLIEHRAQRVDIHAAIWRALMEQLLGRQVMPGGDDQTWQCEGGLRISSSKVGGQAWRLASEAKNREQGRAFIREEDMVWSDSAVDHPLLVEGVKCPGDLGDELDRLRDVEVLGAG